MKTTRVTIVAAMGIVVACSNVMAETPLERGAYLVNGVAACGNCHTMQTPEGPVPGMELAGGLELPEPGVFVARASNITPDVETGVGGWTDDQLIVAIREGKRPDGSTIGPPMPFSLYRDLSDTDVRAMVAYLRSVPAVSNDVAASEYPFPLPPAYGPPVTTVADVDRGDPVAYGAYLAGPVGHCVECHSPPGPNGAPDHVNMRGAGGFAFHGPWGKSVSTNITPTGLGDWSDAAIKAAITTGARPDGSRLLPPMPFHFYANMTDEDLDAIVAYLRTLAPKG